jgi:hypothetical protein
MIIVGVCFIVTLCGIAGSDFLRNVDLPFLPLDGGGTIYSKNYDETKFHRLRVGMTENEVVAIIGEPLRKVPLWVSPEVVDGEQWFYSDQPDATADFWRRWVSFKSGRVTQIISDYWYD